MLVKVIYLNNSFQYFRNVKAIIEKGATYQIEFDDETEQVELILLCFFILYFFKKGIS